MRVPIQYRPVLRTTTAHFNDSGREFHVPRSAGVYPSKKIYITGDAACKKGNLIHSTNSATICGDTNTFHTDCTTAKNSAKAGLRCPDGYTAQHTGTCSAGEKC